MIQDNKGQTVIEVAFTVMGTIMAMTLIILTLGPFVDGFMDAINNIPIPLAAWGQDMMNLLPIRMASWFFLIPGFFVLIVMVWGIKTVVKRHKYTTQDQQYIAEDEF
ncbi:MAG: hypothetical protein O8C58_00990 [Candidatus Methanoperedens sp.]|nr:hypothetical protein [Candidatus Methanoperedens sp.]